MGGEGVRRLHLAAWVAAVALLRPSRPLCARLRGPCSSAWPVAGVTSVGLPVMVRESDHSLVLSSSQLHPTFVCLLKCLVTLEFDAF